MYFHINLLSYILTIAYDGEKIVENLKFLCIGLKPTNPMVSCEFQTRISL